MPFCRVTILLQSPEVWVYFKKIHLFRIFGGFCGKTSFIGELFLHFQMYGCDFQNNIRFIHCTFYI